MKNRTLFFPLIITIFYSSCFEIVKTGSPQYSSAVIDSKENGSFIAEYHCSQKFLKHDSIEIKIKEAWTEHIWYYNNQFKNIKISKDTILLLSIDINNEDYLSVAPNIINYSSKSMVGLGGYTNIGGNKLKIMYSKYRDEISIKFWNDIELILTKK